jgi:hypothetical protein
MVKQKGRAHVALLLQSFFPAFAKSFPRSSVSLCILGPRLRQRPEI